MPRFTIYSPDGQTARHTGAPTYHGTFLHPAYIEFREIASPTIIPWEIGDYVDYTRTGFRYKLYTVPQPTKQAVKNSNGDSFVYRDVQLFCASKDLEIAPFGDLVISDNTIHFTTLPSVSTYEDVYGIARRIQANMDSFFGEGAWVIRVYDNADPDLRAVLLEAKEFSVSDGTCLDALSQIYANWKGIGWVYSVENGVNTITIGRPNMQDSGNTTSIFAYGLGNGIKVLKKEQSGKSDIATRLYAYGSTRNLVARYYNNLSPAIKDAESVYIPNLMIPLSYWGETDGKKDARKAYIDADAATVARFGLRPKRIYFDGTGDYEEIFPSLETMTAGQLRAAMSPTDEYYPSRTFAADHQRVDEVAAAENPSDNGVLSDETGKKYVQTVNLLGVSQQHTYNFAQGQESAKIPLTGIVLTNTITATGKVLVTPAFAATITSGANLGALSIRLWVEIEGVKYGNIGATITRGTGNTYTATVEPFEIVTDNTGEVTLAGYIFAAPTSKAAAFSLTYALNMGTTTMGVTVVPTDSFKVHIRQIGFDISKQQSAVSGGLCTIAFKSGWCAGREFTVKKCQYQESNDRWVLTVVRQSDDSINQYFPNSIYRIEPGDRFVLTDLTMPEVYITAAQQRLYQRAEEVLASLSAPKMVYEPEIDAKVLARSPEIITEGMWMPVQDEDLMDEGREWVLIDTIEIDESSDAIPIYKVTLQDEKRESFISRLTKQSGRNARDITEITLTDLRNEVEELSPSYTPTEEVSVEVVASHPIIGYEHSFNESPVNTVVLTCNTTGIDNPTYQWYYLGPVTWMPISGATGQAYTVLPEGGPYYRDGEIVEDFRCVVNGDESLSGTVQIMKVLANALSLSLSNPAHIFPAGVQYADAATDRSDILGYKGTERFATKVDMSAIRFLDSASNPLAVQYTGGNLLDSAGNKLQDSNGLYLVVGSGTGASLVDATSREVMMNVTVVDNGTTATYLNIEATTHLNIPAGVIEIPVIVQDAEGSTPAKIVKLYYSWSLALQGNASFTSIVFKRSATKPSAPTGGSFDSPVPSGWSDGIPTGTATLWMSKRIFSANGYYPQEAEWSEPTGAFDTADVDFEFSALATDPGTPSNPATGAAWHDTATSNDIWMAVRKKTGGAWGAWEVVKVKGEKGESPLFADIDNEMDGVTVGSDAVLSVAAVLNTNVSLWFGNERETITGIVSTVSHLASNITVTFPDGEASGKVRVAIAANTDFSTHDKIEITLLITGSRGSRSVVYTILAIKEGEDGVVYTLVPDYDVVRGTYVDGTLTYSPATVTCTRQKRKGAGALEASSEGSLRYSTDGGTTINDYTGGVSAASAAASGKIIFYWYIGSTLFDRETVPIVADGAKGEDGIGENGYSASTIYLYKRSSSGAPATAPGATVFTFATGALVPQDGESLNGWSQSIPSGDDPCYITMFFAQANTATQEIPGGWVSAGGGWANPTRLTGDNGLMGKVMRGINEYSQYGLGDATNPVDYQGMSDTEASHVFYDMVYVVSGGTRYYYYCKAASKNGVVARLIPPGSDQDVWVQATRFDFVATKVLLASNAFIDILSGNGVYLYDDTQSYIVAGVQGGTGVNFFAGTHFTGDGTDQTVTPANAPLRINYDGSVYVTNLNVSGGKIEVNSEVEQLDGNRISIKTNYGIRAGRFMCYNGSGSLLKQVFIDDTLSATSPAINITTAGGLTALLISHGASIFRDTVEITGAATLSGGLALADGQSNKIGTRDIVSSSDFSQLNAVTSYPADADMVSGILYLLFEAV